MPLNKMVVDNRRCALSPTAPPDNKPQSCGGAAFPVAGATLLTRQSMNEPRQRNAACALAKSDPQQALAQAKAVSEPWSRAQALAWVARYTDSDPVVVARLAAEAAGECDDDYKRSAVRAWEVAALAERGRKEHAKRALEAAVALAEAVQPVSSRSEALFLLFQAACFIGREQAEWVGARLAATCPESEHWRCKRCRRNAHRILEGGSPPRVFFW